MSIRINNQTIAGNYEHKPTSYRYVGEIFQSAIPITDEKVGCLDGHKVYEAEGYGSFIQHLISQSLLYPQLVCTEEVWQEKVTQYGSCGQFVINQDEISVRLPKIAGLVQGLNTLEDLAGLLEVGLSNIEGGSSETSIQYPYYIVLATGVVQEINVKNEIELNNPFFFGMYQYFETEPNNLSWLKSEGQWNNGSIYESFYEWLVNSYNDTESGVSVKLNTETYTNFDYVLNQDDKTFRLPIEVKQKFYNDLTGNIPVAGNGMTLGMTDGTNNVGVFLNSSSDFACRNSAYGASVRTGSLSGTTFTENVSYGVTTDPTKSGIEAQITQTEVEGLGLYFYVGEVVQNANLINVSKLRTKVQWLPVQDIYYKLPKFIQADKNLLTIKSGTAIQIPNSTNMFHTDIDITYNVTNLLYNETEIQNGYDYYIYLTSSNEIKVSKESSLIIDNVQARQIGGFHTLCVDVGDKAPTLDSASYWTVHPASGYMANDIIPNSVWTEKFKSNSGNVGQAFIDWGEKFWADIYLQSGTGKATTSEYRGTVINSRQFMSHFGDMWAVKKQPASDSEFAKFSEGSNQKTNIAGGAIPADKLCGGYLDTAGSRMISGFFIECCNGYLWQIGRDLGPAGGSAWTTFTDSSRGGTYGVPYVLQLGGSYGGTTNCGSWCRTCGGGRTLTIAATGCRGVSLHIEN